LGRIAPPTPIDLAGDGGPGGGEQDPQGIDDLSELPTGDGTAPSEGLQIASHILGAVLGEAFPGNGLQVRLGVVDVPAHRLVLDPLAASTRDEPLPEAIDSGWWRGAVSGHALGPP
jgi:hypothetical protein